MTVTVWFTKQQSSHNEQHVYKTLHTIAWWGENRWKFRFTWTTIKSFRFAVSFRAIIRLSCAFFFMRWFKTCTHLCSSKYSLHRGDKHVNLSSKLFFNRQSISRNSSHSQFWNLQAQAMLRGSAELFKSTTGQWIAKSAAKWKQPYAWKSKFEKWHWYKTKLPSNSLYLRKQCKGKYL